MEHSEFRKNPGLQLAIMCSVRWMRWEHIFLPLAWTILAEDNSEGFIDCPGFDHGEWD